MSKINLEKTLTTGADGMVGSYVNFGVCTNRRTMDVTDLKEVLKVCRKHKPEVIIHLAAETDVDRCEREPHYAYLVNSIGTYNVAVAAKEAGAKMVYVSTAGVFDGKKDGPYNEDDEPNPQNYYGHSKYLGEAVIKDMLSNYIIARVAWMFGGGPDKDQKFVAKIIRQLEKNNEIKVVTDVFGSPTYAKDLVEALKKLIKKDANGIFHLANQGSCSRFEMAEKIVETLKTKTELKQVNSAFFGGASRPGNEMLSSRVDLMSAWDNALERYLTQEWAQEPKL